MISSYKDLSKILACPECLSNLKTSASLLICQKCRAKFLLVKNKPIFLTKKGKRKDDLHEKCQHDKSPPGLKNKIISFITSFYFPSKRKKNIKSLLRHRSRYDLVLNLGGGNKRYGFNQEVNLDITDFPKVDVVADAHRLPFKSQTFDLVIADALLEHVQDPVQVVNEIHRVLKKRGKVYAMTPFLQRYHSYPQDYTRWTLDGLRCLFGQFKIIKIGVSAGPWVSFVEFNIQLLRLVSREIKFIFYPLSAMLLFVLMILKPIFLLVPHKKKYVLANAIYYLGEKRKK